MEPAIVVVPNECLADEDVKIRIQGLRCNQNVTIHAELKRSDLGVFESYAQYTASRQGTIDVTSQASVGGSYSGIEPMGLFWSMKPSPNIKRPKDRLIVRNVESPVDVRFRIFDSHLKWEGLHNFCCKEALSDASVKRWYKSPDVKRIPVRWKKVRGTLFIPNGLSPFPALIDLYGGSGGIMEYRASLFASRGYVSLALAYFDYDDLAKTNEIDLGYFEEAKEFLESRPETNRSKIGIMGNSLGGMLSLACASCIPGLKCAVSINGPVFTYRGTLRYKDRIWHPKFGNSDLAYEENGAIVEKYCFDEEMDINKLGNSVIEFAQCDKPFLFIFSNDDNVLNNQKAVSLTEKLIRNGKGDYKIVVYPGAGHLLEPPHFPHVSASYIKFTSTYHHWGGEPKKHARAQELAWSEIMTFLNKHLANITSKL